MLMFLQKVAVTSAVLICIFTETKQVIMLRIDKGHTDKVQRIKQLFKNVLNKCLKMASLRKVAHSGLHLSFWLLNRKQMKCVLQLIIEVSTRAHKQ